MKHPISITLDDSVFGFIERYAGKNRSGFINRILKEAMRQRLEAESQETASTGPEFPYAEVVAQWEASQLDSIRHAR